MISFIAKDAQDFQQQLPETGVFDMFDVSILIEASDFIPVKEIEKISTFVHAAINVVDFKVSKIGLTEEPEIRVSIAEVPIHIAENRSERPRKPKKS